MREMLAPTSALIGKGMGRNVNSSPTAASPAAPGNGGRPRGAGSVRGRHHRPRERRRPVTIDATKLLDQLNVDEAETPSGGQRGRRRRRDTREGCWGNTSRLVGTASKGRLQKYCCIGGGSCRKIQGQRIRNQRPKKNWRRDRMLTPNCEYRISRFERHGPLTSAANGYFWRKQRREK